MNYEIVNLFIRQGMMEHRIANTYKTLTTAQPTYLHRLISVQLLVLLAPYLLLPFLDHLHLL